jgi:clan AA aspartic protease (TIGR02281 family)
MKTDKKITPYSSDDNRENPASARWVGVKLQKIASRVSPPLTTMTLSRMRRTSPTSELMRRRCFSVFQVLLVIACVSAQATEQGDDLLSQLQSLQSRMSVQIIGLEKIADEPKVSASGSLEQQLQQVLGSYNHILSRNSNGQIDQVVIIHKKQKTESGRIVVPTRYQDGHFLVSVALSGNGALWLTLDMIVDTGADVMVLPESLINKLGLADYLFTARAMQTANGAVTAKIGILQEVRLAGETLTNVEVAFIADQRLANNSLLGMSALGRYKLILDEQSHLITLFKK